MHWPHLSFQQLWLTRVFGFIWIIIGAIWMRRAYLGKRGSIQMILTPSLARIMSHRERMWALFLGIIQVFMGLAALIVAQK